MGKNSSIHILVETEFLNKLKEEAKDNGIRLSELCRQKLGRNIRLENIEMMLQILINRLIKNGKYKSNN